MLLEFLKDFKVRINESIEKLIPRELKDLEDNVVFNKKYIPDKMAIQKTVIDPIYDLLDRGGKRWRPAFMYLCYKAVGGDDENLIEEFLAIPEIIHNASLIHDDIEDDANIRRGKKCIHSIYGKDVAINCGALMYFLPMSIVFNSNKLDRNKKHKILNLYFDEMRSIHFGQATDIYWHAGMSENISFDQYLNMCACKTGVLARFSAKLGVILADGTKEQESSLYEFAEKIGVAFQIQDDILDFKAMDSNKEFANIHGSQDIIEGKRTLMVLYTLKHANDEEKKRLLELLDKETNTEEEIREAIGIINKYKAIEYSKSVAEELVKKTWEKTELVLKEGEYKEKLREFANYVIDRDI